MPLLDGFTPWPEPAAARYRADGYWTGTTLGSVLRDGARRTPGHTALVTDGRRLTYAELDEAADRVAAGLRAHGLKAGNRLLVHLPNGLPFVLTLFGCFRAAVVPVLALPAHRESELVHLARLSGAAACVMAGGDPEQERLARTVSTAAHTVRHVFTVAPGPYRPFDALTAAEPDPGAPDDARPQDVAVLLLSGGTTGLPKLIPRTHDDYAYNLRASARVTGLDDSTVTLLALPAAHNFALACPGLLGTLHAGGTTVLAPSPDPETAFDLIARERVTTVALVPPLVLAWLDAAELLAPDLSSLTLLQAGGARLKEEAARRVRPVLGCALQQVYGMAEGLLNFTRLDDPDETVFTSQGRPLADADEVRVVGPDGTDVPDGEMGELWTRGPYTLRGYFRAEQHNATAFTPDGFYRSGDLVRRLPGGNLVVEGRLKDVINRGGDKVPVEEVENHLLAHPRVHDVALVGFPDPDMGERTCAFVVPRGEAPTRRDLIDHLVGRGVAAFKHPDRVRTVDRFPRTGAGKVDRVALTRTLNTVAEAL
ncbi:AMP-binding protein [Streptomyces sp. ISL-12]|uniref:(2,3-dihydroxybenzoyl)adenylate synthase n=1 Tax=Streptomyces sp. ISL-12 TaxID=2819177 RepID=UPI001BEBCB05|nr:AMP-binding protein [Streptomyces sp. ISL-12]MBT2413605.1 AMP-binding protein [Streptomyces sp. ISL-12]